VGLLEKGRWLDGWYDTKATRGRFVRTDTTFRGFVTADGSSDFRAEPGRYHLYVSLACPWASRTLIFRKLKRLEDVIGLSVVHYYMGKEGWELTDRDGATPDTANGCRYLREVYLLADPEYTGRVTVPVLWDKKTGTIVNNESAEIIRMLNREFDEWGDPTLDFYPEALRDEIDAINDRVYHTVNDGVYRAGFAGSQEAYEEAAWALFDTFEALEERLSRQRFLAGDRLTEADWRLFTTLVRFDTVYYVHFKCNWRPLRDYPNLWALTRQLYQVPGVAETVDFTHIKRHYYESHDSVNPKRLVPIGPALDFSAPHDRGPAL
jgi:glutathionyl-hydroquinone reductase